MNARGAFRRLKRRRALVLGAIVACLAVLGIGVADSGAFPSVGGEVVIIQDVSVRSPVLTTHDKCMGYVDHGLPVVPVTVKASFIVPGGQPTGPYGGILEWSGGFGAEDDHFGTGQGHSPVQFFHVLARAAPSYYHGAGEYSFLAFAQDVGLAGGFAVKEKTVTLPGPPPSGAGAEVKCTITGPNGLNELLSNIATAGLEKVGEQICGFCFEAKSALENISYYNELTNDWLGNAMVDDPPDANFQQIAQPQEPPVIPPPSGLTAGQQAAVVALEQQYAHDIGVARALETTVNRVWGADNGASRYWHVKQMQALSTYAGELADDLGDYQALYDSLESALAPDLPAFSITEADALRSIVKRSEGFSAQAQQTLSELGASPREEEKMIDDAISVEPSRMVRSNGVQALFS
ncbi:MAG TPA: hypothetical protein VFJ99_06275, partial [Solirubrobacterales bacterium]|nr:hypothetical protein [Solirubrobacterales bacterium]